MLYFIWIKEKSVATLAIRKNYDKTKNIPSQFYHRVTVVLRPSNIIVRAFNGSKIMVHGEVNLLIKVDSQIFESTFYVMDIRPTYSYLLGRSWIHKAGVVTSTLY